MAIRAGAPDPQGRPFPPTLALWGRWALAGYGQCRGHASGPHGALQRPTPRKRLKAQPPGAENLPMTTTTETGAITARGRCWACGRVTLRRGGAPWEHEARSVGLGQLVLGERRTSHEVIPGRDRLVAQ